MSASTPERLAELLAATLPDESLTAEELERTIFGDPDGAVLAAEDDVGAVGLALRGATGFVTVIAVEPSAQRQGIGSGLLVWAHAWLQERGATEVRTGASAPRYLWPGVDVDAHAAAASLFESAGYRTVSEERNHRCPVSFRVDEPRGVSIRRVSSGSDDEVAARAFAISAFPNWLDEMTRGIQQGCCHAAFDASSPTGAAIGFACHSVNRGGWIGPMATDPAWQGRGIGSALLSAVCRDLELAEYDEAEIAWVGPDAFYEKAAGTTVSRRFKILARIL